MRLRQLVTDDDAVSPVIGVILMVAITVILAAVIASFVLGLGPSDASPQAQFSFEEGNPAGHPVIGNGSDSAATVGVTFESGDKIEAQYLSIAGDASADWTATGKYGGTSEIGSGDGVAVDQLPSDWSLSVVWEKNDQSNTLADQSA